MKNNVALKIENLHKRYDLKSGKYIVAIKNISFSVHEGEFVSIVGPSGCGKSTLIKIMAGLIEPSSGKITQHDGVKVAKQNCGVVFQEYDLFPWLNVEDNIGFGLQTIGVQERAIKKTVARYVRQMELKGFEKAYPKELSGGMQQRVDLARTLATDPSILLMDEPFSALDVQTKRFMQDLLLQILHKKPTTAIFVTHDVEEAVFLSDTVYIMSRGPGTIIKKVNIALSRPRDRSVEFSQDAIELKKHIQKVISRETGFGDIQGKSINSY